MRWTVAQIGAREHYAVPRALERRGSLGTLYTDAWCRHGGRLLERVPGPLRSFARRRHRDIPDERVVSFTGESILHDVKHRIVKSREDEFRHYLEVGGRFAKRVSRHLTARPLDAAHDVYFGYNTACLHTLRALAPLGVPTIVDQIDPAAVEERIVLEEMERWSGWQLAPGRIPAAYFDHMRQEWDAATLVLVNSSWSKQALVAQGVSQDKLIVVPLAYEPGRAPAARQRREGPLRVLWLGTVNLRKGIPYLIEAAKRLPGSRFEFVVAGPLHVTDRAVAEAPAHMRFIGRVTRDALDATYACADVFVLPTVSDGFAITQLEAMAHGLPVVTTPHCGEVVNDGRDGFIVPVRDGEALAAALERLEEDRALLEAMSARAVETSRRFTLERYATTLEEQVARQVPSRLGASVTTV